MTPDQTALADEELVRGLDSRARETFLLFELHRVPLSEVAAALGITIEDAARLIEETRRRLGLGEEKQMP
jgi:DNA-directed RNA polymerase specialized sigma24 family protein